MACSTTSGATPTGSGSWCGIRPVPTGNFASLIVEIAGRVEYLMAKQFKARGFGTRLAPMPQMLVGMVALTGQWWLDVPQTRQDEVVAHLVNLTTTASATSSTKPKLSGG